MFTNLEAKPNLLYIYCLCATLALLELLCALVIIFTPVDDFSYRWICVRGHLYEIEPLLSCRLKCLGP